MFREGPGTDGVLRVSAVSVDVERREPACGQSRRRRLVIAAAVLLLASSACSSIVGSGGRAQVGEASRYGRNHQGKPTASGEAYDERALTAAHPSLPLGSRAKVTNLKNGKSVVVRVNDRGPFVSGRIVDLSGAAARAIGLTEAGVARVRVEPIR
jgi:rare lipoprotein A